MGELLISCPSSSPSPPPKSGIEQPIWSVKGKYKSLFQLDELKRKGCIIQRRITCWPCTSVQVQFPLLPRKGSAKVIKHWSTLEEADQFCHCIWHHQKLCF